MRVGVIGAGRVGGGLARRLARAGYEVLLANRRGRVSLMPLVEEVGSGLVPARPVEAARAAIVILAVPFGAAEELLAEVGPLDGAVLVDATNAWGGWDMGPGDATSSQAVARWAEGARVVKAFNTVNASCLADPRTPDGEPLGLPVAGDDPEAVAAVVRVAGHAGFAGVPVGTLAAAGPMMEPGGALFGLHADAGAVSRVAG